MVPIVNGNMRTLARVTARNKARAPIPVSESSTNATCPGMLQSPAVRAKAMVIEAPPSPARAPNPVIAAKTPQPGAEKHSTRPSRKYSLQTPPSGSAPL